MKRIIKKEPEFFSKFVNKENPADWQYFIVKGLGKEVREYILYVEQNYQCAYTEVNISSDKLSSHIDHYRKRDIFSNFIFKWNNLLVASNSELYGAKYKDKIINIGNQSIYELLLNPSIDNPKDYFYYALTGEIAPKSSDKASVEYKKAEITIDVFNLNHKSLVNRRKTTVINIITLMMQYELGEILDYINEFDTFVEEVYASL
jgi:uncharacterized protein (TIGR02646 family)